MLTALEPEARYDEVNTPNSFSKLLTEYRNCHNPLLPRSVLWSDCQCFTEKCWNLWEWSYTQAI